MFEPSLWEDISCATPPHEAQSFQAAIVKKREMKDEEVGRRHQW